MKVIQKKFQGVIPDNKILDMYSESITDTYSCNMINSLISNVDVTIEETDPTVPEFIKNLTQDDIDRWNNNTGGVVNETDPTVPAHVKSITQEDIDNWNSNSNNLGITIEDINKWNNKQDQLVSGVNIKTIDNKSLLGSGNISTEYFAGKGIEIIDRTIINKITSYNDLTDLPFIPTKITDLIGGEDFPTDPENPDETGPWARVDKNNYFRTNQTIIGDVNASKLKAYSQMSVSELGFYLESDGSYTLGRVAE